MHKRYESYLLNIRNCDVIKQNESEPTNIDFEIQPIKRKISFVFYCFAKPSTTCISETNQPIFMGFLLKVT